jgi:hypothetical protein
VLATSIDFKNDPELCQPLPEGSAKGSCTNGQVWGNLQVILKYFVFVNLFLKETQFF